LSSRGVHVPVRTCVACGKRAPQSQLLRLVLVEDQVLPDPGRRQAGRGAYICRSRGCAQRLGQKRRVGKAFARPVGTETWRKLFERAEIQSLPLLD
jgi:predicted RNA-binding protein YlxR (DUF448 family)